MSSAPLSRSKQPWAGTVRSGAEFMFNESPQRMNSAPLSQENNAKSARWEAVQNLCLIREESINLA